MNNFADATENVVELYDPLSDEELGTLALAADPFAPIDPNAVPWNARANFPRSLLPDWYMPAPIATGRAGATRIVVFSLVSGFLLLGAFGLCITCGFLALA